MFSFWGHIRVQQNIVNRINLAEESPIPQNKNVEQYLHQVPGVVSVERYATKSAIIKFGTSIESVLLKGIDSSFNFQRMNGFLKQGKWIHFQDSGYDKAIDISTTTASELNIHCGDSILVFLFRTDGSKTARKLLVSGIFKTGIDEYDKNFALCDIRLIRKLNQWDDNQIAGYEVFLKDYTQTKTLNDEIYEGLPQTWYSRSIQQIYPNIFDWLNLQGEIKMLLLGVMIIIASVNLITCLIILILERTKMIGMLKSLGSSNWMVQKIFLYHASYISIIGVSVGTAIGLLIGFVQMQTGWIKFNEEAYFIREAAVDIVWWQILLVDLFTVAICFITLVLPSLLIRKMNPSKAVQFN